MHCYFLALIVHVETAQAMANIKLDKNMIVSFRFTVADESRLLVVL